MKEKLSLKTRNTLELDTADEKIIIVINQFKYVSENRRADTLLFEIQKLLGKAKLTPRALEAIVVNPGPGKSYTGLRVGVAIANALGWALSPKNFHLVLPKY